MGSTEIFGSLAIVIFAALIHASFQLSVSALTLMSGHAIGRRAAHAKLLRMAVGFMLGAAVMTALLLSTSALIASSLFTDTTPELAWSVSSGVLLALGMSVWLFYYRRSPQGTALWLPRPIAAFLSDRSKHTHSSSEAFGLGLSSVIGESIFLLGPVIVSSLALIHLPPMWQLAGVGLYTGVSMLSLLIVGILIGSGHGLGSIQKWRETNKRFMQFAAGSGLLVLGFYIYVEQISVMTAKAAGIL